VLQALKAASANRTTIMITHRLTAAQMVDRIIVLEDGRIVEQGTYAELIDANGAFSRLAASDDAATKPL
jgi:ABC-type multidrug transport system fused ATPase/permease subunit